MSDPVGQYTGNPRGVPTRKLESLTASVAVTASVALEATRLGHSNVGTSTRPIYLVSGSPSASAYDIPSSNSQSKWDLAADAIGSLTGSVDSGSIPALTASVQSLNSKSGSWDTASTWVADNSGNVILSSQTSSMSVAFATSASYASSSTSASFALNAKTASSVPFTILTQSGIYLTASVGGTTMSTAIRSASYAISASQAAKAVSSSYAVTASYVKNGVSASYATNALSASEAVHAASASHAGEVNWTNVSDKPTFVDLKFQTGSFSDTTYNPVGAETSVNIPTQPGHVGAAPASHTHSISQISGATDISTSVVALKATASNLVSASASFDTRINNLSASLEGEYLPLSGGTITGNLAISGNLYVSGTTVTVDAENLNVKDKLILVASGSTARDAANGAGIAVPTASAGEGGAARIQYRSSDNRFTSSVGFAAPSITASNGFTGSLRGNVVGNLTGTASWATSASEAVHAISATSATSASHASTSTTASYALNIPSHSHTISQVDGLSDISTSVRLLNSKSGSWDTMAATASQAWTAASQALATASVAQREAESASYWKNQASASAHTAEVQATSAATYRNLASSSASGAAVYAQEAEGYRDDAESFMYEAEEYRDTASGSMEDARFFSSQAATNATLASTYAVRASASAQLAEASASLVQTYVSAASSSAGSAATYASRAQASASKAAGWATSASNHAANAATAKDSAVASASAAAGWVISASNAASTANSYSASAKSASDAANTASGSAKTAATTAANWAVSASASANQISASTEVAHNWALSASGYASNASASASLMYKNVGSATQPVYMTAASGPVAATPYESASVLYASGAFKAENVNVQAVNTNANLPVFLGQAASASLAGGTSSVKFDANLTYNASTNRLNVTHVSATGLTGSLRGNVVGTASWATSASEAVHAISASETVHAISASEATHAITASYTSGTASYALVAASVMDSGSLVVNTASFALDHYTPDATHNTPTSSVGNSAARTYVKTLTLDKNKHVIAVTTGSETVTDTDRYVATASFASTGSSGANGVKMTLTRRGSDTGTVTATIPVASATAAGVVTGAQFKKWETGSNWVGANSASLVASASAANGANAWITANSGNLASTGSWNSTATIVSASASVWSGKTANTGTVTSITIKGTSPIAVDNTGAITTSGTRTISVASGYSIPSNTLTASLIASGALAKTAIQPAATASWSASAAWITANSDSALANDSTSFAGHYTPSASGAGTSGSSTARYYVKTISVDGKGHVVGVTTGSESNDGVTSVTITTASTYVTVDSAAAITSTGTRKIDLSAATKGKVESGSAAHTWITANSGNIGSHTGSYLPLTGGTLTGALTGTSGTFDNVVVQDSLTVQKNLYVNGTASYVNTQDLVVKDKLILVSSGSTTRALASGAGIAVQTGSATTIAAAEAAAAKFYYDGTNNVWSGSVPIQAASFTGSLLGTASRAVSASRADSAASATSATSATKLVGTSGSATVPVYVNAGVPTAVTSISGAFAIKGTQITASTGFSGNLTGNVTGTASWASNAVSASIANTAVKATMIDSASNQVVYDPTGECFRFVFA